MRIVTLVENTAHNGLSAAHGLSLYIETAQHKILFDAGPDSSLLFENAAKLNIDLKKVDTAILSHGHYDHAGGLRGFMEENTIARLYIHHLAVERGHYATELCGWRDIGIDKSLFNDFSDRIELCSDRCSISPDIILFSDIDGNELVTQSNSSLYQEKDGNYSPDPFEHEQNLIIKENGHFTLIAGCAHRGIINIINRATEICSQPPETVISGFHLTNPGLKQDQPHEFVAAVAQSLKQFPCTYYTGHCTGGGPYGILKAELGEKMNSLHCGLDVTI